MDWDTLKAECLACRRCELCTDRTHVVFGQGVQTAEVLFVGEGPGQSEDEQGLPFVGRSGQLLDKYLFAIDLDRSKNCYIANIVKCRPPQNRDPLPSESEACMPWLRHGRGGGASLMAGSLNCLPCVDAEARAAAAVGLVGLVGRLHAGHDLVHLLGQPVHRLLRGEGA